MPVKRINPIEQHIEKILVGLAGASLLGVVGYQFLGGGGMVNVAGTAVPVPSAYGRVRDEALRLQAEIRSANPPLPQVPAEGGLLADFERQFSGPAVPATIAALPAIPTAAGVLAATDQPVGGSEGPINNPALPAPTGVLAQAFMSLVDPAEVEAAPELHSLGFPTTPPIDVPAVSVQASLDGTAIRRALEADPDAGGPIRALPKNWWDGTTAIYRVELVRQERQADGAWSAETSVAPMPGRLNLAARIAEGIRPGEQAQQLLRDAQANEEAILRPEWYRRPALAGVEIGDDWTPPAEAEAGTEGESLAALNAQANQLRRRIAQAEKRIQELRSGGPAGGGRPGSRPAPGRTPAKAEPDKGAIANAERNLTPLRDQLRKVEDQIRAKGGVVAATPGAPTTTPGGRPGAAPVPTHTDPLATPAISIWAHDPGVKRGATYRYQVRVWVSNPIFGRGGLPEDQQDLARKPYLVTQASDWTAPVVVPEETPLYITSAAERNPDAGVAGRSARATAEVFTFNWGYWRRAQLALETGDVVVGAVSTIDMDKLTAEIERFKAAQVRAGSAGGRPAPGAKAGEAAGEEVKLELGGVQRRVPVARDILMLDAAAAPDATGSARAVIAYFRDGSGTLFARTPDSERARPDYRRLSSSAKNGEDFLKVRLQNEVDPNAAQRGLPVVPEKAPPPSSGGGGGGGGGG